MRKIHAFLPVTLAIVAITKCQPYQPVMVMGPSMEPTLTPMQIVLGSRDFTEVRRGDLVVFDRQECSLIKRVVGLPGDRIFKYFVGGGWELARTPEQRAFFESQHRPRRTLVIPLGHVFVMGDNFIFSNDSRNFGPVRAETIEMKVDQEIDPKVIWTSVDVGRMAALKLPTLR